MGCTPTAQPKKTQMTQKVNFQENPAGIDAAPSKEKEEEHKQADIAQPLIGTEVLQPEQEKKQASLGETATSPQAVAQPQPATVAKKEETPIISVNEVPNVPEDKQKKENEQTSAIAEMGQKKDVVTEEETKKIDIVVKEEEVVEKCQPPKKESPPIPPPEEKKVVIQKPIVEPVPDLSKFVYTRKHPELLALVQKTLASQKVSYEKRVAMLNERGKKYHALALELHKKFNAIIDDPNWKFYDKGEGWEGYTMPTEDGSLCAKSTGAVKGSPIEFYAFQYEDKYKPIYNENFKEFITIEEYPANMRFGVMRTKSGWIVSGRDFPMIMHTSYDLAKGVIEIVTCSVEDERVPIDPNYVRGEVKIMATRLAPLPFGMSQLVSVSQMDPKGSIPSGVKNTIAKGQCKKIPLLEDCFTKLFGKN